MRRALALLVAVLALLLAGSADARPLPDYDGRGPRPTTASDVALWGPRALAAPLYVVSEYVLRRPLGALVMTAEKNHWPEKALDLFTFDREHRAGLVPTGLVDFGLRPSVGVYFFLDGKKNAVRAHAATWGKDWLKLTLTDRYAIDARTTFALRAEWLRRSDFVFHGVGPRTLHEDRTRFSADKLDARATLQIGGFSAAIGERAFRGRGGPCCDDYAVTFQRAELALDSRKPRPASGTGVRVELEAEHGVDVAGRRSFVRYGGSLGGAVAIDGAHRVLSLTVTALFADPLSGELPIPEHISLGGLQLMRGYLPGRLVDRSALVMTAQYTWPIWTFLDGTLQIAGGNVFGAHLDGLAARLLRMSAALGVRTIGSPDHRFEMLVGLGTETLEENLRVSSARVVFGGTHGL